MAAVAGGAAVAGVGALAVGALKLGADFDDAYDKIRVGTGATGKALDGLKKDFRGVVKDVPTDFAHASTAITELSKRTGQTGKGLQQLAKQELELARITETDLGSNIALTTRLFGDWSIKTKGQVAAMDKLFRASQATGIGVDKLAETVVQFGAPLRQLGFSFDTSIALLSKWEKEGVNVGLVLSGMKIGLGKLAKAGKDPQVEFEKLTQRIKDAGSAGAANKIAIEAFGQRAGPDMAAAVREGRFEIGKLYTTISGGKDTILGAARDTEDFAEKWQRIKNKVFVGLEPIVTGVFDAIGTKMDEAEVFVRTKLSPRLGQLRDAWTANKDAILGLLNPFDAVNVKGKTAADTATSIAGSLTTLTKGAGKAAEGLDRAGATMDVLAGVVELGAAKIHLAGANVVLAIGQIPLWFAKAGVAAGHLLNAIDRLSGGSGHAGDAIIRTFTEVRDDTQTKLAGIRAHIATTQRKIDDLTAKVREAKQRQSSSWKDTQAAAGREMRVLRQHVTDTQRKIDSLHGKTNIPVSARATVSVAAQTVAWLRAAHVKIPQLAGGGRVTGSGGPRSDNQLRWLSPGEFVVNAAATRRHRQLLEAINAPRMASGGMVSMQPVINADADATRKFGQRGVDYLAARLGPALAKAISTAVSGMGLGVGGSAGIKAFIVSTDRLPYRWAAAGPGAYDCSGLVGAVYGKMRGDRRAGHGARYFTTSSISTGVPGLKSGFGGTLNIGVTPGMGHMVGSYGGLKFEARSTRTGIFVGSAARSPAGFARHFHMAAGGLVDPRMVEGFRRIPGIDVAGDPGSLRLVGGRFRGYDSGGWLPPGLSLAYNGTGRPEPVGPTARTINVTVPLTIYGEITASQRAQMHAIAEDMGERVAAELSDALARRGSGV
jgi:phage-related minor tail protein